MAESWAFARAARLSDARATSLLVTRAQQRIVKMLMVGREVDQPVNAAVGLRKQTIERGSGFVAENNSPASQIVRRHFDRDAVALKDANSKATHVATQRGEHGMSIGQLHPKCRVGQHLGHLSFELYWFFLGHETSRKGGRGHQ